MQLKRNFAMGMMACALAGAGWARTASVTHRFNETQELFVNPGQGWMTFQRLPGVPARFPVSVAYFRSDWQDLEPEDGKFNWAVIDDSLQAWGRRGVRIAFRIMTADPHSPGYYSSPKWLFDLGSKGFEYIIESSEAMPGAHRGSHIEPDYSDLIYLEKHLAFVRALGQRYDGNPGIEFIDIGSYGYWGEWHTPHPAPIEVRRKIIDAYLAAFRRTRLAMMTDDVDALAYAVPHAPAVRRDGVGSPAHAQNWAGSVRYAGVLGFGNIWKHAPVIFEWYGPYDYLVSRGWSFADGIRFMLDNHVTLALDSLGRMREEQLQLMEQVARVAGYRFVLRSVTYPERVKPGQTIAVQFRWSNVGVGRLFGRYRVYCYFLDTHAHVRAEVWAGDDPESWMPGEHSAKAQVAVPQSLTTGAYTLAVALVGADGKPAIALATDAPESGRIYRLGTIMLR